MSDNLIEAQPEVVAPDVEVAITAKPKTHRSRKATNPALKNVANKRGSTEKFLFGRKLTKTAVEAKVALYVKGLLKNEERPRISNRIVRVKIGKTPYDVSVREVGRLIGMYHPSDDTAPKSAIRVWTGDLNRAFTRLGLNVVDRKAAVLAAKSKARKAKKRKIVKPAPVTPENAA